MAKHGSITKQIVAEIMKAGTEGITIDTVTKRVAQRVRKPAIKLRNNFDVAVNTLVKLGKVERYAVNTVRIVVPKQEGIGFTTNIAVPVEPVVAQVTNLQ